MAQKTQITLIDDIDGSGATQTVTFALRGVGYEIDLNEDHASALEESFQDWISSARKVTGANRSSPQRGQLQRTGGSRDLAAVRSWLRENGHEVSARGRVKAELMEKYEQAH